MWSLYYFLGLYYVVGLPVAAYAAYQEWLEQTKSKPVNTKNTESIEMTVFYEDKQASWVLSSTNSISHNKS